MRIVRRRVMRSAGANTVGKRINLAAAMLGACSPDECSAGARMQCSLLRSAVRLRRDYLPPSGVMRASSKAKTQTLGLLASVLHDASSADWASALFTAA